MFSPNICNCKTVGTSTNRFSRETLPYPNFAAKIPTIIFLSFFPLGKSVLACQLGNGHYICRSTNRFSVDPLDTIVSLELQGIASSDVG